MLLISYCGNIPHFPWIYILCLQLFTLRKKDFYFIKEGHEYWKTTNYELSLRIQGYKAPKRATKRSTIFKSILEDYFKNGYFHEVTPLLSNVSLFIWFY